MLRLTVMVLFGLVGVASAQEGTPLDGVMPTPVFVRLQLQLGAAYAEQALIILGQSSAPEALEQARNLAAESYKLLRWADAGLAQLAAGRTRLIVNPLFTIASADVQRARDLNIQARMELDNSIGYQADRSNRVLTAIQHLRLSVLLVRNAADFL